VALFFITIGALLLVGLLADAIGSRTRLPRVTLLLLIGLAIGPAGLDLLPEEREVWFPTLADIALLMVGFLLGGEFSLSSLRERGKAVLLVSLAVTVGTALAVAAGLLALGIDLPVALLLAAIAPATAPAACMDVIKEMGARGPFAKLLLGVVAVDDVWGLMLFSIALAYAGAATGAGGEGEVLLHGLWELGGAAALGIALGVPMALVTGRIRSGEPTREEALGMVLLCGGLALWMDVSFLLASVVMGAVVVNLAKHHERPFHEIEDIERPFLVLFFVLSGASLHLDALATIGWLGVAYILLRVVGRLVGGWLGAAAAGLPGIARRWMGPALLPQAGVALGMALVAASRIPEVASVLPVIVLSTVIFELVGPVLTRAALRRVEAASG